LVVNIKAAVILGVMACSLLQSCQYFGGIWLNLTGAGSRFTRKNRNPCMSHHNYHMGGGNKNGQLL